MQTRLTGGDPLPATLRQRMESGFGTSFGDVRIHTGGQAASATRDVQAEAFARGSDIAFAPGRFHPGTPAGDKLIAHELAHVVQQRASGSGGAVQAKSTVSAPGDSAETAADRAAETVLAGGRASLSPGGLSLRGRIQRRALAAAPAAPSPALSLAPARPGAVAPGAGPVLTPVMTSAVSPAGGQVSGLVKGGGPGAPAPTAKSPDEAQTARGETAAEARSPAGVMTAGAPAGAASPEDAKGKPKEKKKKEGEKAEAKEAEKDKTEVGADTAEQPAGRGRGGGGRAGRTLRPEPR